MVPPVTMDAPPLSRGRGYRPLAAVLEHRDERVGPGVANFAPVRSEQPSLGEADRFPVADDEVVDEAHVDERERFGEPLGDGAIGNTWLPSVKTRKPWRC